MSYQFKNQLFQSTKNLLSVMQPLYYYKLNRKHFLLPEVSRLKHNKDPCLFQCLHSGIRDTVF